MITQPSGWLQPVTISERDPQYKSITYLPVYESYLGAFRDKPFTLLELGVAQGASLMMWATNFPKATIVGLDIRLPTRDNWPANVHLYQGDQTDSSLLGRIAHEHAPLGFDIIIDDASHIGDLTCLSLDCLYRTHLAHGGLYFIEDWGTGYWSDWPDGLEPEMPIQLCEARPVRLLPNHLHGALKMTGLIKSKTVRRALNLQGSAGHREGMVGLIKRLVDHVGQGDIHTNCRGNALGIASMSVYPGLVALQKFRHS